MAVDDKLDIWISVKAIQHRQKTLARDTKGVGYALGNEAFDQQVAG